MNDKAMQPARPLAWWREHVIKAVDHRAVIARVHDDAVWSGHFAFMTLMSAGIAILGLLLSSPAVVIGAMLISPLMGPILGSASASLCSIWRRSGGRLCPSPPASSWPYSSAR